MCTEKSVKLSVHLFMDVSQTSSIHSVQKVIVPKKFPNFYQNAFNVDMQIDYKKLNFDSAKIDCHVLAQLQALHAEV